MPVRGTPLSLIDWQVLAEVEVASDCDYVDFTGLDINRDWFYILMYSVQNSYAGDTELQIFFNEDYNKANYYRQEIKVDGTTIGGRRDPASGIGTLRNGVSGEGQVFIHQDSAGYILAQSYANDNISVNVEIELKITSTANPKNNLISIRITTTASGAIGAGSRFILARPRS